MDALCVQAVVLRDVVYHGPGEDGVVVARGQVARVVGVALVGAGLEAEAGRLPRQDAGRAQRSISSAGMGLDFLIYLANSYEVCVYYWVASRLGPTEVH